MLASFAMGVHSCMRLRWGQVNFIVAVEEFNISSRNRSLYGLPDPSLSRPSLSPCSLSCFLPWSLLPPHWLIAGSLNATGPLHMLRYYLPGIGSLLLIKDLN